MPHQQEYRAKSAGSHTTHSPLTLHKISSVAHRRDSGLESIAMAPQLTEDEIDDLVYFARTGENDDLTETLTALAEREKVSPAEVLLAAKDEGKSTALHMATGNGHLGMPF